MSIKSQIPLARTLGILLGLSLAILSAACGVKGPPLPPIADIPQRSDALIRTPDLPVSGTPSSAPSPTVTR
jgi:hypothetical protein